MRDLTANMQTAIQADTLRPVTLIRMDIVDDPLSAWTGPGIFAPTGTGDAALDGQTFEPAAPIISLPEVTETLSTDAEPYTFTATGEDLDLEFLRQVIRDKRKWLLQPIYIWKGLLNADEATVIPNPYRLKTGLITNIETLRDGSGNDVVNVTIDVDLGLVNSGSTRLTSHTNFFSTDTYSTFLVKLANKPSGFTAADVNPPPAHDFSRFNFGGF